MASIFEVKEQGITDTPLFLFDCELVTGDIEHWSTHNVTVDQQAYQARVLGHNLYEIQAGAADGIDAVSKISLTLADADSYASQIERNTGWKGAKLTITFLFFNLKDGATASDSMVLFRGIANAPDEITESELKVTFTNRLSLQRAGLPTLRVQRRCPWTFPATDAQRQEAAAGGTNGKYSLFYPCGYTAGLPSGAGNLNSGVPYASCDYSRGQCEARGMFDKDGAGNATCRFGGIEFVPPTTMVRTYGASSYHVSQPVENEARYNDLAPLVYGTAWFSPMIVFAKNDGNLTRMEVLLGSGEMQEVLKVLVGNIEIPLGQAGANMTGTGWYNVVSQGGRTGAFNPDYRDKAGKPTGDPYGSMAYLSVVVPNRISDGTSLPKVQVLMNGLKLTQYGADGLFIGETFTNNPAWIVLDILRRSGWELGELDLASFASAAAYCDQPIQTTDLNGNTVQCARFQCNLVVQKSRSAADVVRGIRNGSRLFLSYGSGGVLQLRVEGPFSLQQPAKPAGSNSTAAFNGGWPAYEFGDSAPVSGILRNSNGAPSLRVTSLSTANTPNRLSLEFQDAFNEYQQDSLSLVAIDDVLAIGQEISSTVPALGVPSASQAARIIGLHLAKSIQGNSFVQFGTSVRGIGLAPGDLITVTYLKEGWSRQPFRITKIVPGTNYRTSVVTAQIHSDDWYTDDAQATGGTRRQQRFGTGLPRPLIGSVLDDDGEAQFQIQEKSGDDPATVALSAGFVAPKTSTITSVGIPLLSLAAAIGSTSGTLAGGQTLYYAISAVDANGAESPLSFVVRATIAAGAATNTVTLSGLSFSATTQGFQVYRGSNPTELYLIASNQPVAAQFEDTGLAKQLVTPPDESYDHANFYWRLELRPVTAAAIYSANTIGSSALEMTENAYRGMTVRITKGRGAGQERTAAANTADTLTVSVPWDAQPDNTSNFVVAESGWHFAARTQASPVELTIPNRAGATVHVSGRSANVYEVESAYELSPLTRWRIGTGADSLVPGLPIFGLTPTGRGGVELGAVAFQDLANTDTITSATVTLHYWDELKSPAGIQLSDAVVVDAAVVPLSGTGTAPPGSLIQIDREILIVTGVSNGGAQYQVTRGAHGTAAAAHNSGAPVYHLGQKVFVVPFVKDFFGSPASGSFSYVLPLADARIASAELFVTNGWGSSEVAVNPYTSTLDGGLRTLSGGQFSIQVEGYLAIQNDAAPVVVAEGAHSIRDIFAVVQEAPAGAPIQLQVKVNGSPYGNVLTIPDNPANPTTSNVVNCFGLAPLAANAQIGLDVISVGQTADTSPGRNLTVTIRL